MKSLTLGSAGMLYTLDGYCHSVLHGLSNNVVAQVVQGWSPGPQSPVVPDIAYSPEVVAESTSPQSSIGAPAYSNSSEPLCDEFELDTDDEEEVYEVDDEVVNLSEDDGGVQADEEDAECPDIRVVDKIDPELQYEICETALGDCGCVTGPDAVKRRIRWSKGVEPPDCRQPKAMGAIEKAMRNSKNRSICF